ncbi:hypothetical protein [Paenibacillus sp. An7]|uniref:hypothetical protein n=1 Tax=Paenibacillus sp. An7 TaxID=2689577 RepID=UPI0013581EF3|nr:hypothetical protein [Paenibacillus sp. An7]
MSCDKIEGIDFGFSGRRVKLQDFNGRTLCEMCLVEAAKLEKPNPADAANKYIFDQDKFEWILDRVKIACATCGKSHWVSVAERSWRKQCKACYKRRFRTRDEQRTEKNLPNSEVSI